VRVARPEAAAPAKNQVAARVFVHDGGDEGGGGTFMLHSFSKARVERPIAAVRVVLASASLFAIWLDPAEPARPTRCMRST
jgi:hypothetical protein